MPKKKRPLQERSGYESIGLGRTIARAASLINVPAQCWCRHCLPMHHLRSRSWFNVHSRARFTQSDCKDKHISETQVHARQYQCTILLPCEQSGRREHLPGGETSKLA